ncbi:helix-turn-helix transcriptional regulator [Thermoactinomyces sp. FSL K6-2592]|jgi:hypothetical protein|uniref:helix-turn-helix domain-containing protein n=1 Tax=Thermoactinomyces sp. FSL K6-2592 TaxID=2975347 RepID=UPI0030F661A3
MRRKKVKLALDKILEERGIGQRQLARMITDEYKEEYPDVWVDPNTGEPREKPDYNKGFRYTAIYEMVNHKSKGPLLDTYSKICTVLDVDISDILVCEEDEEETGE